MLRWLGPEHLTCQGAGDFECPWVQLRVIRALLFEGLPANFGVHHFNRVEMGFPVENNRSVYCVTHNGRSLLDWHWTLQSNAPTSFHY